MNAVHLAVMLALATSPVASQTAPAAPKLSDATPLAVAFPKTYNRIETAKLYSGLLDHVGRCANVQLTNARGVSLSSSVDAIDLLTEDEMIDALKQGRVQLAQVTAGLVPVATDTADAKAFAVRGDRASGKAQSYRLNLIVRTDSVYRKPLDLKGKTIAHSTPGSNSGNLAPRAYFPGLGLRPDADYTVVYSKGHERSITGVLHGFYDGAAVASDQLARMARKGEVRMGSFRVLWESPPFPVEAWMLSRAVAPAVQDKVMRCVGDYRIPPTVSALLDSADRYVLIDAEREFAPIRFVLDKNKPRSKP